MYTVTTHNAITKLFDLIEYNPYVEINFIAPKGYMKLCLPCYFCFLYLNFLMFEIYLFVLNSDYEILCHNILCISKFSNICVFDIAIKILIITIINFTIIFFSITIIIIMKIKTIEFINIIIATRNNITNIKSLVIIIINIVVIRSHMLWNISCHSSLLFIAIKMKMIYLIRYVDKNHNINLFIVIVMRYSYNQTNRVLPSKIFFAKINLAYYSVNYKIQFGKQIIVMERGHGLITALSRKVFFL